MATVTSASTRQQVLDAIADNASYIEDSSRAKCLAFITAVRVFLHRWSFEESRNGSSSTRFNTANLRMDLESAESWLLSNPDPSTGGGVVHMSVECFRG